MTIRTKLLALLCSLSLVLVGIAGWQSISQLQSFSSVRRAEEINRISTLLIDAGRNLAVERGLGIGALSAAAPANQTQLETIRAARQKSTAALTASFASIANLAEATEVHNRLAATEEAWRRLQDMQRRADAAMQQPLQSRDTAVREGWFGELSSFIDRLQLLRRAIDEDADMAVLELKRLQAIAHLSWGASEVLGRERGFVNGLIVGKATIDGASASYLDNLRGRLELIWPELEVLVLMLPQHTGLQSRYAEARKQVVERFPALRQSVLTAGRAGQPYPVDAKQWFSEATATLDAVLAVAADSSDQAAALSGRLQSKALVEFVVTIVIGLLAGVLVVVGFNVTLRQIVAPLRRMTEAMAELARGRLDIIIPGAGQRDEIGGMADAMAVFKSNAEERVRLTKEQEKQRREFEAARAAQEAHLDKAFGQIIEAAAGGDLSRRVDVGSMDGVMKRLADGMNRLLALTDTALAEVGAVLTALARGDLTKRVESRYDGVFGRMKDDTNAMADRLSEIVSRLNDAAVQVRNAAAEISTGSTDLAQRTESQAASLEETAASMQQITTTVKGNADSAQAANNLAANARTTAETGGRVVHDAVGAMKTIEESARKIADIVSLIDEIAFQTNLLALNASVEAARAGEAGKGFAVVAQEVRALAQRSANASKEIKALITESNAQVRSGAGLVNQAGSALGDIVGAIKKVSDIVAEIAAASQEQATGLEQVNTAVGSMDEATQRNSALVEQTSASARSLSDQAEELAGIIGFFKIRREWKAAAE